MSAASIGPDHARRCVDAYIDAWNEPDEDKRRQLLARVMSDDGSYVDPDKQLDSPTAIAEYIGDVLDRYPGRRIARTSEIDAHHLLCRFNWQLTKADGTTMPECVDIVEFTLDGRILRVMGFFGLRP